jgi:hypothetical protein
LAALTFAARSGPLDFGWRRAQVLFRQLPSEEGDGRLRRDMSGRRYRWDRRSPRFLTNCSFARRMSARASGTWAMCLRENSYLDDVPDDVAVKMPDGTEGVPRFSQLLGRLTIFCKVLACELAVAKTYFA